MKAPPPVVLVGADGGVDLAVGDRLDTRVLIPPTPSPPTRPPSDRIWTFEGESMGTGWSVRATPPPGADRDALQAAIEEELEAVDSVFSPWRRDSEVTRFNAAPAGVWALSSSLWMVLNAALDLADDTNGAVDPTLGALVDLWGFGPPGPRPDFAPLPGEDEIEAARAVSGWRRLRLNRDARAAVQPGGMKLDFGGVAKGHAVDRISERLTREGATAHLVEIGGEVRGAGVKPDGQPWWVELEAPPGAAGPRTVAALYDIALATSGDYRRAFVADGTLYPHTLDGATGRPVGGGVSSVSVFHASAMTADAWATALTVLGPDDGPAFAEAMGLAALFVVRTAEGLVERASPAFLAMAEDDA